LKLQKANEEMFGKASERSSSSEVASSIGRNLAVNALTQE